MNPGKLRRFVKYFLMMFSSLSVIALIVIILVNFDIYVGVGLMAAVTVASSLIAARDARYLDLF